MTNCVNRSLFYCSALLLTALQVNAQTEKVNDLYQQTSEVNNVMVQYNADNGNLVRFYTVENSPERRARLLEVNKSYQAKLQALNFDNLNTGTKVDYVLFDRKLKEEQYQLQLEEKDYNAVKKWFPFADSIYALEKRRRRGLLLDPSQVADQFNTAYKTVQDLQKKFAKENAIAMEQGKRAEGIIKGLRSALKSTFEFYNGYDPMFTWWVPQPYKKLDSVLAVYSDSIKVKEKSITPQKDDGSGIFGNPIGASELQRRLQLEMIAYTPDELVAIANKEFAWCDQEMLKASREMGFGDNWKQALEKVKTMYVKPGEQPAAMLALYNESVEFIKSHDLITIPPLAEETWRMRMMTPKEQLINPFFTGGEEFSISYPTNSMSQDEKLMSMRGNNPHFSRATVHHELFAGHSLQEFSTNRYKTYRHFETPFWIEGWALYWEMLLWDQGFAKKPEDRIGMLFWRMHRCARIIFSLNYHTGKWTPQQCIDFLVDRVGHERANAEGEVRRSFVGSYDPLYQIAYMIGGLQIMSLKRELVDSGKMTFKQFHDAFIQQNMMPIEMERAILENKPPAKDFTTSWKFYNF
ncbi:DUF885 family protein [Pinibacter aurantiacus]|uniref:DUF885 domain-containing protein n=1 Tax=Pinibacter aurantiacus TaxID=2851599 RepID=A0A9E2W465_9BACT|nr:DUF885 family protein [Pinibacter aurantiacus]MBV4357544.1 DUF885 domain-containing protein [Pinibacter aurantiacus]